MLENTKAGQYRPAPAHRTLERFKQHHAPASLRQPATRPQGKMITGPTQNSDKLLKGPTSKTSARSQTLERGYGRVEDRGRGGRGCAARCEAATAGAGTGLSILLNGNALTSIRGDFWMWVSGLGKEGQQRGDQGEESGTREGNDQHNTWQHPGQVGVTVVICRKS